MFRNQKKIGKFAKTQVISDLRKTLYTIIKKYERTALGADFGFDRRSGRCACMLGLSRMRP